jgi:hypothetical protein
MTLINTALLASHLDLGFESNAPINPFIPAESSILKIEPLDKKSHDKFDEVFFVTNQGALFSSLNPEPESKKKEPRLNNPSLISFYPIFFPHDQKSIFEVEEVKKIPEIVLPTIKTIEKELLYTIETTPLSHKESLVYLKPDSIFDGLVINLEFFDTNPMSIKIELQGHPQSIQKLSPTIDALGQTLKTRFPAIDFSTISLSLSPLMPTGFNLQKSENKVSRKKTEQRKIVFKSIKATL